MLKIGHRGAKGYEPENTLRSFQKALDLGVDIIEFDVHVCKSGEVVIIHDFILNRTTNGSGFIGNKNLEEIKKLNTGKNESIPTLEEALDLIDKKCQINIELKGLGTAKPVSEIINKYINKGWSYNNFFVSSFNYFELKKFKKIQTKIRIGFVSPINVGSIFLAKRLNAWSVNVYKFFTYQRFVDAVHKKNLKIFVYTVNNKNSH